ncbi:MAG: protein-disulfide reductase DsbD [Thiolinea sp.]
MKNLLVFLLLMFLSCNAFALKQKDLLPPDQAFRFSAQATAPDLVKLKWDIADGYYMYRKRFSFDSETEAVNFDSESALFPPGKMKQDPNLGEMEVYYNQVVIEVPLKRSAQALAETEFKLKAKFQGCAEAGLCYPPQRKRTTLTLASLESAQTSPPPSPESTASSGVVSLANLKKLKKAAANGEASATEGSQVADTEIPAVENDNNVTHTNKALSKLKLITASKTPLPVDEAFRYTLIATDKNTLNARWEITPEHNLYRTKISFSILSPSETQLGQPEFPDGKIVNDEFFGEMEVYDNTIDVSIPLENSSNDQIVVETRYQGCSNATGICYPPVTQETTLALAGLPETATPPETPQATPVTPASQTDDFFSGSFLGTLVAFFVIGLGLSLTPCIFPMIPILSGIIAGQTNLSAHKAFVLSLTYVIASATAYALIGLVFGFFGENLQSSLQHPIAIGSFAALFVILSLSMFGFFDLQMPNSIQSRLNEISNNQRSGSLLGAAIMGFLSTLIVGPCVAPALAAALTYIANTKDAVLGASALFSMGFGMGVILLIVGTLGGHLMPRAGAWMDTTKAIFGIMLLGMAIWMLDRIVPIGITMFLSGILLVSSGIYMGALDKLHEEAAGWDRFWKSIGLIMLFYGSTQLLGVSAGSTNILQPLKGVFSVTTLQSGSAANSQASHATFQRIKSSNDLDQVLATATQNNQLVLLDFYADWCVDCIRMEKEAFADPAVQAALQNVILLQADVTKHDELDKELEQRFGIIGPPTIIFFDKTGKEINNLRMIGYENTTAFLQRAKQFTGK